MTIKRIFINLGKLLVCVAAYYVGIVLGGLLTAVLQLQPPAMPEGMDASAAGLLMMVQSPLMALVLIGLARHIAGTFWMRALMLASFAWITNSLNNQIEASFFGEMASGFWFTIIFFLVPTLLVATAVAWLFPPISNKNSFAAAAKSFFSRYPTSGWIWRLSLGAVLFMPIYYFFGLLVIPFTADYYRQGLYGLQVPPLNQLLLIMFVRSVFYFLACLPILMAWQGSRRNLIIYLGVALFYFVGFQPLSIATWMPWSLRLPHLLEILADEFVYAWALVMLVGVEKQPQLEASPAPSF
ncbi:MAG: hypothetical protein KJ069_06930 [Anaerolineae bacterium]|nr:hypothetical protein [Anaerolineae bacterium]